MHMLKENINFMITYDDQKHVPSNYSSYRMSLLLGLTDRYYSQWEQLSLANQCQFPTGLFQTAPSILGMDPWH